MQNNITNAPRRTTYYVQNCVSSIVEETSKKLSTLCYKNTEYAHELLSVYTNCSMTQRGM